MEELGVLSDILLCFSLIIGAVECFAGYKILKSTLFIWGFLLGAACGVGLGIFSGNIIIGVVFVLLLSIVFALLFYELEIAGRVILTMALMTIAIYIISEEILIALMFAVPAGIAVVFFAKHVFIFCSGFSGVGIVLFSAFRLMDEDAAISDKELFVPVTCLWLAIGIFGILCQYITTRKGSENRNSSWYPEVSSANPSLTFSEMRYPGMQRAYRNFCINCGYDMQGYGGECPNCGFRL